MNKNIIAFIYRNKPKPFFFIKPFYDPVCQLNPP